MKLHCEICALYDLETGKHRMGSQSEIALINTEKLRLPLDGSMFDSFNADREVPAPWQAGVTWEFMKCPRGNHLIFIFLPDDTPAMKEQGGPKRLLTDEGFIKLTTEGYMKPVSSWEHPLGKWNEYMGKNTARPITTPINRDREFMCDCGKVCKSKAGLVSHMRHCNNGR